MQKIYLAKPGGQKEGPYTLEQINHDLATRKYSDEDFWAWHAGLPAWVPLHSLPGVSAIAGTAAATELELEPKSAEPVAATGTVAEPEPETKPVEAETAIPAVAEPDLASTEADATTESVAGTEPEPATTEAAIPAAAETGPASAEADAATESVAKAEPESATTEVAGPAMAEPGTVSPEIFTDPSMSSGKPFSALEQIFVFTTGEGPSAFKSEMTAAMLSEAVGETLDNIRSKVPVDIIGRADGAVLRSIRAGSIPNSVWRALFAIKPAIAQQARDGAYHLCVRTFPVESNEAVVLFLLYNREKL